MSIDYTALKTAILGDATMKALVSTGEGGTSSTGTSDQAVLSLLNSLTGPNVGVVSVTSMTRTDFLLAIAPAYLSLPVLSAAIQAKWDRILNVLTGAAQVDITNTMIQALMGVSVTDGVLTADQVAAIGKRTGSYAEVLFGANTVVVLSDVSFALRSAR